MRQMEKYGLSIAKMLLQIFLLSTAFRLVLCQDCAEHTVADGSVTPTGVITDGSAAFVICNTGYYFADGTTTPVTITCDNGNYDNTPSCTIIDCGNPTTPGYMFGMPDPNTEYLSTVEVQDCATGFEGSPSPDSLTCEASGSWTTLTGCTRKECVAFTEPTGYVKTGETGNEYESIIYLECATGYTGTPNKITCHSNKQWTTPTGCNIIDCGNPTTPGYSFETPDPNNEYLSTVEVPYCAHGYEGTPSPTTLECEASGSWRSVFGCTRIECVVFSPPMGYVITDQTGTNYESTIFLECATGYTGAPYYSICQSDATWTSPSGCIRNVIGSACTADGDECSLIVNGECGSNETCACQAGYTGNNADDSCYAVIDLGAICAVTAECQAGNGGIGSICDTADTGTCICDIVNSFVLQGGICVVPFDLGADCSIMAECQAGNGGMGSTCDTSGTFTCTCDTANSYVLHGDTCILPIDLNAVCTITAECQAGNGGVGSTCDIAGTGTCICDTDSSFVLQGGTCVVHCGPPIINITAGYTIRGYTSTTYKSIASIDCATGYTGLPADIVCQNDAKWSNPSGCFVVDCGFPPEPMNGRIILADGLSLFGYLAIQSCELGYDLGGTTTIQCLESGSWSAEPINCTIKDCGKLFAPLSGFINDGVNIVQSTYLSRAIFTSKDGYQFIGISERQCEANGKWDGTENPSCEPKGICASPPLIYNAVSTLNSVGSSATYQCLAGYELVNSSTNTLDCTDKGWSYDTIQCKLQDNLRLIRATFMFTTVIVYDLSIPSVNAYYRSQCQMSLQSMFRHKMGSDHVVVHVTDVRRGPLAADSHIIFSSTKEATIQLYIAVKSFLAADNYIMIDGLTGSFSSISIESATYDVNNIESKLCSLYEGLQSGCQPGFECVISSGLPECRLAKSAEVTFKRSSREAIPQGALSSSYGMTVRRNERAEDQYDTLAIQNECYEIPVSQ